MCYSLVKNEFEINSMRLAGRIAAKVMRKSVSLVTPGITTLELDNNIGEVIKCEGATSAFLGYKNFPRNCCVSINEAVVHGIGNHRRIQFGDLVKLDIGISYNGFIGDMAMSIPCGSCSPNVQKLLDVTVQALHDGIQQARHGNRVNSISKAIQNRVESNNYNVVREFVGHGVGKSVHEEPQIPNFLDPQNNARIISGMTIAIEPMVNLGSASVEILPDGWTVITRDRQISAHFEHTVLITDHTPEILTIDNKNLLF